MVGRWFARTTKGRRPSAGVRAKNPRLSAATLAAGTAEATLRPLRPSLGEPRKEPERHQEPQKGGEG